VNRLVAALSKCLEPAEREVVCGDVEELRLKGPAAAGNIVGLVLRRQMAEWLHWGPWVALLGVCGLDGFYLSESVGQVGTGLFLQIRTYVKYGVGYEAGGVSTAQEVAYLATATLAIFLWSWACGFVLASLSRRVLWMTSALFYVIVRDSSFVRFALAGNFRMNHGLGPAMLIRLLPVEPLIVVFLLALALGIRAARKATLDKHACFVTTAAGITSVLLLAWMETWFPAGFAHWSGQAYHPAQIIYRVLRLLACAWPLFVLPLVRN
jgi:hypothetical protein